MNKSFCKSWLTLLWRIIKRKLRYRNWLGGWTSLKNIRDESILSYQDWRPSTIHMPGRYRVKALHPTLESQDIDFLDTMNINATPGEVSACHTLRQKNSASPPLIVMWFVNRKSKVRVMRSAALNWNGLRQNRVYLNDYLTSTNASIFRQVRDLLKKGLILGIWTRNSSVFVKFLDDRHMKVITVRDLSQLSQFTTTKDGGPNISWVTIQNSIF